MPTRDVSGASGYHQVMFATYVRSTHCADCGAARLVGKRPPRPRWPARGGGASERGVAGTVQKGRKNTGFVNNSGRKYLHLNVYCMILVQVKHMSNVVHIRYKHSRTGACTSTMYSGI